MGVPTFYTRLLEHSGPLPARSDKSTCACSSPALLAVDAHATLGGEKTAIAPNANGMTETNMITSNPYDGERRPGAVGFALPGVGVRIADLESGAPVQAGEIGVIEVKGPDVFAGYSADAGEDEEEFRADGYSITGDWSMLTTTATSTLSGGAIRTCRAVPAYCWWRWPPCWWRWRADIRVR